MRFGFTTGSCAAAAAKAAAYMLLTGKLKEEIRIRTPKGIDFNAQIVDIDRSERSVSCAVIKDGGDDPDITTGCHVVAKVSIGGAGGAGGPAGEEDAGVEGAPAAVQAHFSGIQPSVHISGGKGVGLVTKPGLDQEPGNAAINSVPRQIIQKEVLEVCELCDYKGALEVEISVPEGEALALKTFNPRLGIEGGISILGTSGIVEPMSSQALLDTIKVELRQKWALGCKIAVVAPGNYGLDFMKNSFSFDLDRAVKCPNFIGDSLEMAVELGFEKYLLVGHIGKLIKLSGGIMNTHSKIADCRMELLAAAAIQAGSSSELAVKILSSISTEEGCKLIKDENDGLFVKTMKIIMEKILFYINKKAQNGIKIECITFCNSLGLLAESDGAEKLLEEAKKEGCQ